MYSVLMLFQCRSIHHTPVHLKYLFNVILGIQQHPADNLWLTFFTVLRNVALQISRLLANV